MALKPEARFIISADDKSRNAIRSVQANLQGLEGRFRSFSRSIGTFAAGIGSVFLVKGIIDATIEQENALRQLEQRIKSTGGVAGVTRQQLEEMASGLQSVTTFGDEAILAMQGILLTFTNIRGQAVERTTEAVLDLSVAMGQDLKSSAVQLGKALNDPVKNLSALSRTGIQFSEDQTKLIKRLSETGDVAAAQNIILDELQRQFGGAARAAADTLGGSLQQLKNAFGDLLEGKGGVNDSKSAIQQLTALLQDPATIEQAQQLTGLLISGFTNATTAVLAFKNLYDDFVTGFTDVRADDIVRLEDRKAAIEDVLNSSLLNIGAQGERLRFFGKDGVVEWYSDSDLERELQSLQSRIDAFYQKRQPAGPVGLEFAGPPALLAPPGASEEFAKLEEQLKQQIALFGKTGEAAKLRYQIESGALDDLSVKEQQQILRMAERLDSIKANVAAQNEQKKSAEALQKAFDTQIAKYQQQNALTAEASELDKVRFEFSLGALKGINSEQQFQLELLAAENDARKELEEQTKKQTDAIKSIYESTRSPQEKYIAETQRLNELLEAGAFTEAAGGVDTYWRAVKQAGDEMHSLLDKVEETENGLSVFAEQAGRNIQDAFADFLFDPFDKGLKGMLESFAVTLRRMVAEAAAAQLLQSLGGATAGSTNPFGQAVNALFGGTRDSGGRGYPGMAYAIGTGAQPEVFVPDSLGTFYPRGRGMGGGSNITVNQNLPRGSSAETRRSAGAGLRDAMAVVNRAARYA